MAKLWKKGRGKLGPFQPLHGAWIAEADSQMGPVRCQRTVEPILGGHYLQLRVRWEIGPAESRRTFEELAIIGVGSDGQVGFSSFTSDGKHSQGSIADTTDLHPEAVGFEADMPAGRARMAYWPEAGGGFHFVVEAKTQKGWSRMVDHSYHAA